MNARKHGLRTASPALLPSEDTEAWESLVEGLREEHQPDGATEELLVLRLASAEWKRRRAEIFEAGALEAEDAGEVGMGKAAWRDANKGQTIALASKYARSAETSFYAALHELERRRARRSLPPDAAVPASLTPVAVDVNIVSDADQ